MIDIVPADTDDLGRAARREQSRALRRIRSRMNPGIVVGSCGARISRLGVSNVFSQTPMLTPDAICNKCVTFFSGFALFE